MTEILLLLLSFAVILAGALLFINAIEWAGHRLEMGEGAVGSLLAAVCTAMPETMIPIVAIISAREGSEEVAIGAIIGAPFLLATIAMAIVGLSAILYRNRRPQGRHLNAHMPTLERDIFFFLVFFSMGLLIGIGIPDALQWPFVGVFVLGYAYYVRRTLRGGGAVQETETLAPLVMAGAGTKGNPATFQIVIQSLVGLGTMIGGAHLFVEELVHVAESFGVSPLVLSLVLAPLATELPEKANSFFWVRQGKDSLALGNITGAMVFQSTIPIAIGLAFTQWDLSGLALLSGALGIAGGAFAYWALRLRGEFRPVAVAAWALLYLVFIVAVIL